MWHYCATSHSKFRTSVSPIPPYLSDSKILGFFFAVKHCKCSQPLGRGLFSRGIYPELRRVKLFFPGIYLNKQFDSWHWNFAFRSAFLRKQDDLIFIFPCKHVVMSPQNNYTFPPCLVDSLCGGISKRQSFMRKYGRFRKGRDRNQRKL